MSFKIEINTHNLDLSDSQKDSFTKKIEKLERFLSDIDNAKLDLNFNKSVRNVKDRFVAQLTVRSHRALLRTEERSEDLEKAFDLVLDKMPRQMERYKAKHFRGRGDGRTMAEVSQASSDQTEEKPATIFRRKTFDLIPMSEGEALEQMKLLGHDNFFIFFNIDTASINVLYQRRDGTYGLIEPKVG
jgi:putative sigma-54 modulation protein